MHKIRFPTDPLGVFKGPSSKGREGKEGEGKREKRRRGQQGTGDGKGRGSEEKGDEGKGRASPKYFRLDPPLPHAAGDRLIPTLSDTGQHQISTSRENWTFLIWLRGEQQSDDGLQLAESDTQSNWTGRQRRCFVQ